MIHLEEALRRTLARVDVLEPVEVPIGEAAGATLAVDLVANADVPPFDNSAMDGFAVRVGGLVPGVAVPVTGRIRAGATGDPLEAGVARQIMTGAPVPEGADAVVMVEHCTVERDAEGAPTSVVFDPAAFPIEQGRHIRTAGGDLPAGAVAVHAGGG
ncbi:MAG: hypothetical protein R2698_02590 [Microthrixaceae bacterium]